jgi:hypothetical protein
LLDAAHVALSLPDVDNLAQHRGELVCSTGQEVLRLSAERGEFTISDRRAFDAPVSFVATGPQDSLAIGLDGGGLLIVEGPYAGLTIKATGERRLTCPTAALFLDQDRIVVANGAAGLTTADWKRDLMERGASGELWLIDLSRSEARPQLLAGRLAFPSGLARAEDGELLVSEAWLHRVIAVDVEARSVPRPLLSDLPAYPGRIAQACDGGFWLALFAPRNQLVEFVLREHEYRRRMIDAVDPAYWIAPSLAGGASFLEPIQGGARKKLNMLKPWSPSWSYGLLAHCSPAMRPLSSFHSRADGAVHGVTSCCEAGGTLYIAAKGSGLIVAIAIAADETRQ